MFEDVGPLQILAIASVGALAGLVRGFTGFGPALVFMPVAGAILGPATASPILFLVDSLVSLPVILPAFSRCRWRDVAPLSAGAALTVPIGVGILAGANPLILRWIISLAIVVAVAALASGWRYRGESSPPLAFGVGTVSGFIGGLANLYGPPIVLFWLGGQSQAPIVRANIFAYSGMMVVVAGTALWFNGLFGERVLMLAFALLPVYAIALWAGTRAFRHASDSLFRWIALVLCGVAALAGLPVWDGI